MSALMLPELAREISGSNHRMAETLEAESLRLNELRGKPQEADALKRRAPRSAHEATSTTLTSKANIVNVWQLALEHFEDGMTKEQSLEVLEAVRNTVDNWLRAARNCRHLEQLVAEIGGTSEPLQGLDRAEEEVSQIKAAVEKMQAFLSRQRPAIDPNLLERGRQEIIEGKYRTGEQIRSRWGQVQGAKE